MKRLFLVPALGVVGLALAAPAHAQLAGLPDLTRPSYAEEARQPYNESRRLAYDTGYSEGAKEGERDARRRESFNYQDERTWQRADKGYHRSFGDRQRYEQTFRTGYAAGYSDAYRRYSPNYYGNGGVYPNARGGYGNPGRGGYGYPGQDGYGYPRQGGYGYPGQGGYGYPGQGGYGYSPAYSNGVNDGYEKGREDARDRDAYDPLRHKWYREGDHDYKNSYGPRQQYENVYRQGFKEGYDRGYREWSYRR
jgi:flagellar biosynthesis/type III secretory pathway protein FliH